MSFNLSALLKKPQRSKFQTPYKTPSEPRTTSSTSSPFKLPALSLSFSSSSKKRPSFSPSPSPRVGEDSQSPAKKQAREAAAAVKGHEVEEERGERLGAVGEDPEKPNFPSIFEVQESSNLLSEDGSQEVESAQTPARDGEGAQYSSQPPLSPGETATPASPGVEVTPLQIGESRQSGDTTHVSETPSPRLASDLSCDVIETSLPYSPGGANFNLELDDSVDNFEFKPPQSETVNHCDDLDLEDFPDDCEEDYLPEEQPQPQPGPSSVVSCKMLTCFMFPSHSMLFSLMSSLDTRPSQRPGRPQC